MGIALWEVLREVEGKGGGEVGWKALVGREGFVASLTSVIWGQKRQPLRQASISQILVTFKEP